MARADIRSDALPTPLTVIAAMRFERQAIHGIDLHRRPDGNLHTRPNLATPAALE